MIPEVTLREFQYPADYPAVLDLWEHAGPGLHVRESDQPAQIEIKLQRDPDLFLVAVAEGKIVGSVIGGFDGRRGMVYHVAVEAAFRRSGVGNQLMTEVERRLAAKGCIRAYLLVANGNTSAMHFYEQAGWNEMDLHIFAKDLPK